MSLMNKLGNCKNPYQGSNKKVLCVCSAGLLRSPSMARVLAEEYDYNTRAAGINKEYALIDVTDVLIKWADEIVVAEEWMGKLILDNYDVETVTVLDIPDKYGYMDKTLVKLIKERYEEKTN